MSSNSGTPSTIPSLWPIKAIVNRTRGISIIPNPRTQKALHIHNSRQSLTYTRPHGSSLDCIHHRVYHCSGRSKGVCTVQSTRTQYVLHVHDLCTTPLRLDSRVNIQPLVHCQVGHYHGKLDGDKPYQQNFLPGLGCHYDTNSPPRSNFCNRSPGEYPSLLANPMRILQDFGHCGIGTPQQCASHRGPPGPEAFFVPSLRSSELVATSMVTQL